MKPAREAIICDDGPFGRAANDASIATLTRERDAARAARQAAEGDLLAATRNEQRTLAWVIALQKQFPDFAAWSASAAALSAWAAERKETP